MPVAGAETLGVPALEAALKTSLCVRGSLDSIKHLASDFKRYPDRDRSFDPRLDAMIGAVDSLTMVVDAAYCEKRLAQLLGPAP